MNTPRYWLASFALLLAGFATFASLYDVQPLLPALAREFAVTPATASLALSASTLALAGALFVAGSLSEALGRKLPIVVSLAVSSAITFLCALVPNFGSLLALRLLEGAAISGVPAIAMAYISEEVAPEALGFSMGLYVAGTALGGMSGRFIVGFAADAHGWRAGLLAIGALGVVCAVAVALLLPSSRNFTPQPQSLRLAAGAYFAHVTDAGLPWLYATSFLIMGAFVTIYNYIGFRLAAPPFGLGQSAIGAIFAVYLVGSAASAIMGRLADRYGRRNMLWLSELIFLAGALITLAGDLVTIVAGITVLTFGFFGAHSVASSWVGRRAIRDRSHATALYLCAYYLGSSVLGSLGGVVYGTAGWSGTVVAVVAVLIVALLIAIVVLRVVRPVAQPAQASHS
ncbi:MAG TPA: MFS transporter [Candidatus Lustribacter sp.]|jgi:YNFM family putative membrane transporter|nr:MFS transporter [Candidatus Lustribacter sp.]